MTEAQAKSLHEKFSRKHNKLVSDWFIDGDARGLYAVIIRSNGSTVRPRQYSKACAALKP